VNNGVKPAAAHEAHYETQMANLRNSLLQHIQSVQKEITRLQLERQRAQQTVQERQVSNARTPQAENGVAQANGPMLSGPQQPIALSSPQASSRAVSSERSADRFRRPPTRRESHGSLTGQVVVGQKQMLPGQTPYDGIAFARQLAADTAAIMAAQRIQTFWRQKAGKRRPRRDSRDMDISMLSAGSLSGQRAGSLGKRRGRQRSESRGRRGIGRFVAINHAACRIQRAWKVSRWRRRFVDFSEREIGWVGTLDWLQHNNLLYGTELADPEDVRWWMQQRSGAPLDREVDPWGCTKLRDHLNKMWYGRSIEEATVEAQRQYEVAYLEAAHDRRYEQRLDEVSYLDTGHDRRYEQRLDEVFLRGAQGEVFQQEGYLLYEVAGQPWCAEPSLGHGRSASIATAETHIGRSISGFTTSSQRSPPSSERSVGLRAVSGSLSGAISNAIASSGATSQTPLLGSCKATSLSPRRASPWPAGEDGSARLAKSQVLGAPPPALQSYQSPPQTHRATRATSGAAVATAVAGVATTGGAVVGAVSGLRPRSPVSAHRLQSTLPAGRLSLTGSGGSGTNRTMASVQRPSPGLGRPLSGSPPPAVPGRTQPTSMPVSPTSAGTSSAAAAAPVSGRR